MTRPACVLVVDDSLAIRAMLQAVLGAADWQVVTATDGRSAPSSGAGSIGLTNQPLIPASSIRRRLSGVSSLVMTKTGVRTNCGFRRNSRTKSCPLRPGILKSVRMTWGRSDRSSLSALAALPNVAARRPRSSSVIGPPVSAEAGIVTHRLGIYTHKAGSHNLDVADCRGRMATQGHL